MLKHSISHYGSTGTPLQTTQHPLTSSSHSGDTSHHLHHSTVVDPTRFIEGPPPHHTPYQPPLHQQHHHQPQHSHSKSYLEQSYPSIHNSRLFLDSSRISRVTTKDDLISGSHHKQPHNGSIYYSPGQPPPVPPPPNNVLNETSNTSNITSSSHQNAAYFRHGILRSLSLLSILSLLLALNSLYFLLQIVSPLLRKYTNGGEVEMMYEVTLCLSAMCLSINLCVLLVSSAQFFFAVSGSPGSTSFLQKVTVTRGIAIGGFFLSIPIFLSAIVLYTFTHLTFSPPALIATACVGTAIIFGGCSMVHQVFTWQQEKTAKRIPMMPMRTSPYPTIELSTLV